MDFLADLDLEKVLVIAAAVVALASAVATITPNQTDNKVVDFISKLVNKLALNVGKAKNDPSA